MQVRRLPVVAVELAGISDRRPGTSSADHEQASAYQARSVAHDLQSKATAGGMFGVETATVVAHLDDPLPVVAPGFDVEALGTRVTERVAERA